MHDTPTRLCCYIYNEMQVCTCLRHDLDSVAITRAIYINGIVTVVLVVIVAVQVDTCHTTTIE